MSPFLREFPCLDNAIPFHEISVEHYMPALDQAIIIAKENIEKLKNNPEKPNFENTIVALETSCELADTILNIFSNLESAHGGEPYQKLAPEIYPKFTDLKSDISLDEKIFQRVKHVYDQQFHFSLTGEQKRLLENTYKSFVRNGALLSQKNKERMRQIDQELSILSPKFSENVLKATNAFEMVLDKKEDVVGIPEMTLEAARHAAETKGHKNKWLFNLQYPSYLPFITYAQSRILREKMWKAAASKAFGGDYDNQEVIKKILFLKHERAQLLEYKNHADFTLSERMAQSVESVNHFLDRLLKASKGAAIRDLEELKKFANNLDGINEIQPWDVSYYSEKLKEKKFHFNEEELRPYFKLENVIQGVFEHARLLYGIVFRENKEIPGYHPEVKVYEIFEENSHKYMGLFYVDLFPRETKKNGAWMTSYRNQGLHSGAVRRPHISIVCNFTKPTPTKPSLLNYDEVNTLFHEFGHALHGILSNCTYASMSGTNTLWDFVELPSQIMENWTREKDSLDLFAKHYETQKPIPTDLVKKIKAAQNFQAGWNCLRQLNFAIMDMKWHSVEPSQIKSIPDFEESVTSETRLFPVLPGTNNSCSFSHIFAGGYSAGYYSYKWAEVLDADAFEYFLEKGIFNQEVATKFKENILSRGDSEHPMELYKKFRGREPDPDALLRRDGLI